MAGNVVPDRAVVILNHRFAPTHHASEAFAHVEDVVAPYLGRTRLEMVDVARAPPPASTTRCWPPATATAWTSGPSWAGRT